MSVFDSFFQFQEFVNADNDQVEEARNRRRLFESALGGEPDVLEVVPSGSLARGTHKDPIHDVDLIAVYDETSHEDWGKPGDSAEAALDYVREQIHRLLNVTNGEHDTVVRLARWRNHAVKCFLDDPEDPDAFTVDVMPAFRTESGLLIPEVVSKNWVQSDPEFLISESKKRHTEWRHYAGTVRMLKQWGSEQPIKVKSLVMEVLALDFLPTDSNQPGALRNFFTAAAYAMESGLAVEDPAGHCGLIQQDLNSDELGQLLREASERAADAITAQANNNPARATSCWAAVFGDGFPVIPAVGGGASEGPRPVKDSPQG